MTEPQPMPDQGPTQPAMADGTRVENGRIARLLHSRRFLPLFATQFLGAFNDNFLKNAMVILILFRLAEPAGLDGRIVVTLATGLFILPFFLFSATAGQIADRFDKARVIRATKLGELLIMALAAFAFLREDAYLLLAALFLMGAQSAFFGPVKYAILPDHLASGELVAGNAMIEAATFLAILLGTIAGGLLVLGVDGTLAVAAILVVCAFAGLGASLAIPKTGAAAPTLRIDWNLARQTRAILGVAAERRDVFRAILGISWFWAVGAIFLSQFPAFARDVLGGDETVVTLLLTVFSVGIGLGSLVCAKLLRGEITAKYVPIGALGMAGFAFDLALASAAYGPIGESQLGAIAFAAEPRAWRVLADLLLISVFGGLYIVPLYAILQARADEARRSRAIAANNVLNALFIVAGAGITAGLLALGLSVPDVFLAIAGGGALVALYICRLLPRELMKTLAGGIFRLAYGVEVHGGHHLRAIRDDAGPGAVIVVNHVSFLDAALLAAFLPGDPLFAIDTQVARRWWVRPFLLLVRAYPLDPGNPLATKSLIREVKAGHSCVIFPEGRITVTGSLMKVYEGPGMIADKAGAPILPVQLDGPQFTHFSRLEGKLRRRLFPKIILTILEPRRFAVPESLRGRRRRQVVGNKLYDLMSDMMFEAHDTPRTLFQALLDARGQHGGKTIVLEDIEHRPRSYDCLIRASLVLGRRFAR
ncbi:MAG TPA: MFS transporter [Kiloniellales bacterium]|nr:MFS transporter [Kiloniellales bacterium]